MSDAALQQFCAVLRGHGHSITRQRRAVFLSLQGQEPLTMHEVARRTNAVDRASVYRAIELFERLGIVQRLQTGWKYRLELSDAFHSHHHHATCLDCRRTIPLPEDQQLEALLSKLAAQHQFALRTHQLELQGYCNACAATQA